MTPTSKPPSPEPRTVGAETETTVTEPQADARRVFSEVSADLLRLADRIEREHAGGEFCACCSTDAIHLRDLAARYARKVTADA